MSHILELIIKAQDQASATTKRVSESIKQVGTISKTTASETTASTNRIKSAFNTVKTSISNVGTKVKESFNSAKNSVQTFTNKVSEIKGRMSEASSSIRNTGQSMSFLRNAASMTVGMLGYDLVNSITESTRATINARLSIGQFASRLNMSGSEVSNFQSNLDRLQGSFKKIDMDVVGQQATDMAYRLGLPKEALNELTETTAIFTDAMQRNGRSAEDSMLAMSDAMDGEFRRLKEIGISQQDLMDNGWSGDINDKTGLLKAMNGALKDQNYDVLAKGVDNLDDAWQVLTVAGGNLIEAVLIPMMPAILGVVNAITSVANAIRSIPGSSQLLSLAVGAGAAYLAFIKIGPTVIAVVTALKELAVAEKVAAVASRLLSSSMFPWIAIIGAVAIAVYELGKYFGLWNNVGDIINMITSAFSSLGSVALSVISGIVNALGFVTNAFNTIKNAITSFISKLFESNADTYTFVSDFITIIATLPVAIPALILNMVTRATSQLSRFVTTGISKARAFFNGIINNIKNTPGRVGNILSQAGNRISSVAGSWTSKARSLASRTVSAVTSGLGNLSSAVYSRFSSVASAISRAAAPAISAASSFGARALSAFKNAINSHSPSDFYKIPAQDFGNIAGAIKSAQPGAVRAVSNFGSSLTSAYSKVNDGLNLGTDFKADVSSKDMRSTLDLNINHDFTNLPAGVDANEVSSIVLESIENDEFIRKLTSNKTFQNWDLRIKNDLARRNARNMGV